MTRDDHPRCACKRCHRAKKKPAPLPRAVRELLRDVVVLQEWRTGAVVSIPIGFATDIAARAARILGTTPADIVAKARKAGRR